MKVTIYNTYMVSPHLHKKFQRIFANLRRGLNISDNNSGLRNPPHPPLATPLGHEGVEGEGRRFCVMSPGAHDPELRGYCNFCLSDLNG